MKHPFGYNLKRFLLIGLLLELFLTSGVWLVFEFISQEITGFRIGNQQWWPLLIVGPLYTISVLLLLKWKNKKLDLFGDHRLLPYFAVPISNSKTAFRFIIQRIAISLLIIAILNPRIGSTVVDAKSKGIDIAFCLDVSNSMLAEDLQPNRLGYAKRIIERMVDQLKGDRISLIVFAGEAYMQLPLTADYGAAKLFLSTVSPELIPVQGTSLASAINRAMEGFDFEKNTTGKAIVILTDGESHEGDANTAAQYAADNNIPIYCLGIGSIQGAPIPVKDKDFKKDKNGQVVISTLNEEALTEIAQLAGGFFVRAGNDDNGIDLIINELNKQTKKEVDTVTYADYEDRFQWFALGALVLLTLDILISNKKTRWLEKINWFNSDAA